MTRSTVTSKGQITIPKSIRDALQLDVGDRVQFRLREDGVVEMQPETGNILALAGILRPDKGKRVSVEGMKRAVRTAASRR
jgi:AbrB family looped-hinge helix DNA binding protein